MLKDVKVEKGSAIGAPGAAAEIIEFFHNAVFEELSAQTHV